MRRSRFLALLLALAGSAGAANAGLKATIDVDRAWLGAHDDVVAKVRITNDGTSNVLVPRWQVPGNVLDARLFDVRQDGASVTYTGRLVKRAALTANDYVVLAPGKSVHGRTELTRHYDMESGGEYAVTFRMDLMDGVDLADLRAASDVVTSNTVSVFRDAPARGRVDWSAINAPTGEAGTVSTIGCSSSDNVTNAVNGAKTYSTGAKNYMQSHTASNVGPRYTTWFGTPSSGNVSTVTNHYVAIEDAFLNKAITIDCTCTQNYYAYVYPTQPYKIYVCNAYRSAPTTGTDSKAGTLVHEMSHFNVTAGTDDWAYGQTACKSLAKKKVSRAIDNADSHEYFAENTPSQN